MDGVIRNSTFTQENYDPCQSNKSHTCLGWHRSAVKKEEVYWKPISRVEKQLS
jgi:hypothetical protein